MTYRDKPSPFLEQLEPRMLLSAGSVFSELVETAQDIAITPTDTVSLDGTIQLDGQTQSYRVTASATGKLWIDMCGQAGQLDSLVQVYGANGRRYGLNDNASRDTLDSRVRVKVKPGQTYYIMASGANSTTGSYQLTMTSDPVDDVGNMIDSAKALRVSNGRARGQGTLNYDGDVDMFSLTTDREGPMEIDLSGSGRYNDLAPELAIYDPEGNQVIYDVGQSGSYAHTSLDVQAGETYYIRVAGEHGSLQSRAKLAVSLPADDIGDTFPDAFYLALRSGKGTLKGATDFTGDVDVVSVIAASSAPMQVKVSGARRSTGFDGEVFVYDAAGVQIGYGQGDGTSDVNVSAEATQGQTYYIAIAGSYLRAAQKYTLTVECPEDDIGQTMDTSLQLPFSNGSASSNGTINFASDIDMFNALSSVTGTMTIDVSITGRRNDLDPIVAVYNADLDQIAYDDDSGAGLNSRATLDVDQGETYYIVVGSYGSTVGDYAVSVDLEGQVLPDPEPEPEPDPIPVPGDPQPGAEIMVEMLDTEAGWQLRIAGTDQDDVITISQSLTTVTVTTAAGSEDYTANFVRILVYSFDGDDTIRLTSTVSVSGLVYAGAGNDTVFESGQDARIYGEAGDDLIVTVGGGSDTAYGGTGLDSFWVDSNDNISDASSSETSAKTVHVITEFYQPYTSNPGAGQYVSLEIAGQNFTDPAVTSVASGGYSNFAAVPLFVDGPQYDDIRQGSMGDCYYLASLAALADSDPLIIQQMITPLGDGTFAVRFNRAGQEVYLRIDADLPVNSGGSLVYAKAGPDGELWVPLAEKAYAHFRYGENSYASLNGGWMSTVLREITGGYTNTRYTGGTTSSLYTHITDMLDSGYSLTLGSTSSAASPVVGSHAYMVKSAEIIGGQQYVTVYNPWGWDGRTYDDDPYDGLLQLTIQQIQDNYTAVVTSLA